MDELYSSLIKILAATWRHRWIGVLTAWLVGLGGIVVVFLQDDVYEASARVYVNTTSQLRQLLDGQIVDSEVQDQLRFVRQSMLGRPNLERLAREVGLAEDGDSQQDMLRLIARLSASIQIVSGSDLTPAPPWERRRTDDTYLIRYQNSDRELAVTVVDKLLTIFVDETIGAKRTSSRSARDFLSDQIEEYESRLQKAESALAGFNKRNADKLPNLQGGYFQSLQTANSDLDESQKELKLAESRLANIERQIRGEMPASPSRTPLDPNSIDSRILEAERRLDDLRLRFTDAHPDVVAARESLARLHEQQEIYRSSGHRPNSADDPVLQALLISRNEAEAELAELRAEVAQHSQRVEELQSVVEEMPEVEAEMVKLNRDYNVVKTRYETLLNTLEQERLSSSVLESEELEFRVIDPPAADPTPIAPNRLLLFAMVLFASVGSGFAAAYAMSQLKPVCDSVSSLAAITQYPVLGSVSANPASGTASEQNSNVSFLALCALLILMITALGVLSKIGV